MTEAKKDLEIWDYPLPEVLPGCILVRITCCTICGSDLHTWTGRRKSPVPIILGHEIVGRIVELGAGVLDVAGEEVRHRRGAFQHAQGPSGRAQRGGHSHADRFVIVDDRDHDVGGRVHV